MERSALKEGKVPDIAKCGSVGSEFVSVDGPQWSPKDAPVGW